MRQNIFLLVVIAIGLLSAACRQSSVVDPSSSPQDMSTMTSNSESQPIQEGDREAEGDEATASTGQPAAGPNEVRETADLSKAAEPSGPTEPGAADRYFPLDSNQRREFQVEIHRPGKELQKSTATRSIEGTKTVEGRDYVRVVTKAAMPVRDQLYRVADDGIYAAVDGSPGNEMLILPAVPKSRPQWSGSALPVIKNLTGQATWDESYQAVNRKFDDCIRVTLSMTLVVKGFFGGATETPVRLERWFAPDVGMVAEVREVGVEGKPDYQKIVSKLIR